MYAQLNMDPDAAGVRFRMFSGVALSDTLRGLIPTLPATIDGGFARLLYYQDAACPLLPCCKEAG